MYNNFNEEICFLFDGPTNKYGYGRIYINGKIEMAHRHIFFQTYGNSGNSDKIIISTCGNKNCINPRHLKAVKRSEKKDYLIHNSITPKYVYMLDKKFVYTINYCEKIINCNNNFITNKEKKIYENIKSSTLEKKALDNLANNSKPSKEVIKKLKKDILSFTEKLISWDILKIDINTRLSALMILSNQFKDDFCIEADWNLTKANRPSNASGGSYKLPIVPTRKIYQETHKISIIEDKEGKSFQVLHKCGNPKCVNQYHLKLGTHLENMKDKVSAPVNPNKENSYKYLNPDNIRKIMYDLRLDVKLSYDDIGKYIAKYLNHEKPFYHHQVSKAIKEYAGKNNLPLPTKKSYKEILVGYEDFIVEKHHGERKSFVDISKELKEEIGLAKIDRHTVSNIYYREEKKRNLPPLKNAKELALENAKTIYYMHDFNNKSFRSIAESFNKKYTDVNFYHSAMSKAYDLYKSNQLNE